MKKTGIGIWLCLAGMGVYAQQPPKPQPIAGTSALTGNSKWVEQITLKKRVYNIYVTHRKVTPQVEMLPTDTLIEYQVVQKGRKFSTRDFVKFATRQGKISGEGSYRVSGDTLVISINYYDFYHSGRLIEKYVPDQYDRLQEVNSYIGPLDTDSLPDTYIKQVKDKAPVPAVGRLR